MEGLAMPGFNGYLGYSEILFTFVNDKQSHQQYAKTSTSG